MSAPAQAATTATLRAAGCVFADDEAALLHGAAGADARALARLVARRCVGEPLEHLLGRVEFAGMRFVVAPGVFVPRRRSELLADTAAALAASSGRARPVIVELCCGCGAVGAAAMRAVPAAVLYAVDVDPTATACAHANLAGTGALVLTGDLDAPLPGDLAGGVDVVVANAPYVPTAAIPSMPREAREHEPLRALDGGPDGLGVVARVVALAPRWLRPGGHVAVEVASEQLDAVRVAMAACGLASRVERRDDIGATVAIGTRAGVGAGA